MPDVKVITGDAGEVLQFGPTRIRILEDGSRSENRISAIASMMPAHVNGPRTHVHLMHDETFLVTSGVLHFIIGDLEKDAMTGDYIVVPAGAPHTFVNASDQPVSFFTTFTPGFYVDLFRQLAKLNVKEERNAQLETELMIRYATVICD